MTTSSSPPPSPVKHVPWTTLSGNIAWQLGIWGLLQLFLLGIGLSGFPLWSHHPYPREALTFQILICGQMILVGGLAGTISRSWQLLLIAATMTLAIDSLAAVVSHAPFKSIAYGWLGVMIWSLSLVSLHAVLAEAQRVWVVAVTTSLTLGAPLASYLADERRQKSDISQWLPQINPIATAINISSPNWLSLLLLALPGLAAATIILIQKLANVPSPTSFHLPELRDNQS